MPLVLIQIILIKFGSDRAVKSNDRDLSAISDRANGDRRGDLGRIFADLLFQLINNYSHLIRSQPL